SAKRQLVHVRPGEEVSDVISGGTASAAQIVVVLNGRAAAGKRVFYAEVSAAFVNRLAPRVRNQRTDSIGEAVIEFALQCVVARSGDAHCVVVDVGPRNRS